MSKLLTVSVAAYNIENYLDKLMASIIDADVMNQIEVLIIDDGSKDRTAEISKVYQDQYPGSVRLISKENAGHGSTINRGIHEALGKYFRALDGDDWVDSIHFKRLVQKMDAINADVILTPYRICYSNGTEKTIEEFSALQHEGEYVFDEYAETIGWMRYHTVIYRTELLKENHIALDENCFYVDAEFMLFPIPFVSTIYYSNEDIYCYRLGIEGQSVSPESRKKHIDNGTTVAKSIISYYNKYCDSLSESKKKYFQVGILNHCNFHYQSFMLFTYDKQVQKKFKAYDSYIKKSVPHIYKISGARSRKIQLLRLTAFHAYPFVCWYKEKRRKK